jgi:predicted acylesterase/phospholipase RssA
MPDALVLAGAVVKGAFTAGALSVLSETQTRSRIGLNIRRIVGTSSGALNGTYYAAALHAGEEAGAAKQLAELWEKDATAFRAIDPSLRAAVFGKGLSTQGKLLKLLRDHIPPRMGTHPIELRLVVTNIDGRTIDIDGRSATTFEQVCDFSGDYFTRADGLEQVFAATVASAALPVLYAPATLEARTRVIRGLDGGLVNNAPLGLALRGAKDIDRVFVIVPSPRIRKVPKTLHGLALAMHVFDIIVEERLVRDLQEVENVNRVISRLKDPKERALVLDALEWAERRTVKVVEIRPDGELPGDALSGFVKPKLRKRYLDEGAKAARAQIARLPPLKRGALPGTSGDAVSPDSR